MNHLANIGKEFGLDKIMLTVFKGWNTLRLISLAEFYVQRTRKLSSSMPILGEASPRRSVTYPYLLSPGLKWTQTPQKMTMKKTTNLCARVVGKLLLTSPFIREQNQR
jgi:hypothetical protein